MLDNLWQVQGRAGREPAAGVRIGEKAESTDTEVTERKLSETVRGSLLQSTVKTARMENKVRRKDRHNG